MSEPVRRNDAAASQLMAAVRSGDIESVRRLLVDGANPRVGDERALPLHVAARHGPLALVELLIAGGARPSQPDRAGRTALEAAKSGGGPERSAIVALLDRTLIHKASFRSAVDAIHSGAASTLARLIDEQPQLLHERNYGPGVYRQAQSHDYFRDPKLFWFVANNPKLVERMAPNIREIASLMIERGVERDDLQYTLMLTMTGSAAREQGHQASLMQLLLSAGAVPDRATIIATAGHAECDALRVLLAHGQPLSALIAAALGDGDSLRRLLSGSDREDVQTAFGLAIINGHAGTAQVALDAGADINAYLPVHAHSTALHQAAIGNVPGLISFLLARGARADISDTLWDATALEWAIYEGNDEAARALAPML